MDTPLRDRIAALARELADAVVAAISGELAGRLETGRDRRPSGRPRRTRGTRTWASEQELRRAADRIVTVLRKHPGGLRAEKLRAALGYSRPQMARPLALVLRSGQVRKVGVRRRTTYHPAAGKASSARPGKAAPATASASARNASKAGAPRAPATSTAARKRPAKASARKKGPAKASARKPAKAGA